MGTRKKVHIPVFVFVCCGGLLAAIAWFFWPSGDVYGRQTIVVAANPVMVVSYSAGDKSLISVSLPADLATEGTHGYGTYSLEAFWRLGDIDKKDSWLLSESISEMLGIPVQWYLGPKKGELVRVEPETVAKRSFSLAALPTFLWKTRTNMPLGQFLRLALALQFRRLERNKVLELDSRYSAISDDVTLPDGSHQSLANAEKIDVQLKGEFEDERARRDAVTVAVYNTTSMASLGTRAARMLSNAGISVVQVGNDTPEIISCSLKGEKRALESVSARLIYSMFGCTRVMSVEPGRADLLLHVGSEYQKRFEKRSD